MRLTRLAGLALALILLLTGCSPMVEEENSESLSVYATFYPIYALAEMVIGGFIASSSRRTAACAAIRCPTGIFPCWRLLRTSSLPEGAAWNRLRAHSKPFRIRLQSC